MKDWRECILCVGKFVERMKKTLVNNNYRFLRIFPMQTFTLVIIYCTPLAVITSGATCYQ